MTKAIITINGRTYDAITGMPIKQQTNAAALASHAQKPHVEAQKPVRAIMTDVAPASRPQHNHAPAQAVHQVTQKSHTLYRKALKKPAPAHVAAPARTAIVQPTTVAKPVEHKAEVAHKPVEHRSEITTPAPHPHHERSPLISKFGGMKAPVAQTETRQPKPIEHIAPAAVHPAVAKALQQQAAAQPKPQLSGSDLKEQLIKERLAEVSERPTHHEKKAGWLGRQPRLVTILSSTLALLILGGYLTYITLPSISLRVAASRAGVNASMPEYKPDGYSLDGPITYSPGEVVISYKSNTDTETGYKLVQKATNWDSQAVLDNYVAKLTDNYLTYQERGITVYTFGNKAAWVNGGLLYTIEGNAALSSDQILKVATSI